jgi:hypothetical protein
MILKIINWLTALLLKFQDSFIQSIHNNFDRQFYYAKANPQPLVGSAIWICSKRSLWVRYYSALGSLWVRSGFSLRSLWVHPSVIMTMIHINIVLEFVIKMFHYLVNFTSNICIIVRRLIDSLLFYAPLSNLSLIWIRHHNQWRAAKFRPLFCAQGLWAGWIFIVPHLL